MSSEQVSASEDAKDRQEQEQAAELAKQAANELLASVGIPNPVRKVTKRYSAPALGTSPHPIDNFQISEATKEYGQVYSSRGSPKTSPRLSFARPSFGEDAECSFRVRLSGIQCRNLEPRKFRRTSDPFVEFHWADRPEACITPVIKGDLNPTWKGVVFIFEYISSIAALKEKKLVVKVYSSRTFYAKTLIGEKVIDLYTIATGPVHHDHSLSGCENGRIVFNCYFEQYSEWNIAVSSLRVLLPAIRDEIDRREGHDYREDASLPLEKYAISYKCTIGASETFYVSNSLKTASKCNASCTDSLSSSALARLKSLSRKLHPSGSSTTTSNSSSAALDEQEKQDSGYEPVGVMWSATSESSDCLPDINRYSTFDELMSATLKVDVRYLVEGRGQVSMSSDTAFMLMVDKYIEESKSRGEMVEISGDIRKTSLYGQCWLSLETLFEDAIQERFRKISNAEFSEKSDQWVQSEFEQSLALKGHQCGYLRGKIIFKRIPFVRQLRSGVISENGITSSSSVIVALPPKKNKKGIHLPEEAQRVEMKLKDLMELMCNRHKDEKDAKIRKATKILRVLQTTQKASMLSWLYSSSEALDETKQILIRLWGFLLENIRVRDYTLRNIFYELLYYLMKRAELGNLSLLGFDFMEADSKAHEKDIEFGFKLRQMYLETKCCVLQAVSIRGILNNNFMFFVARMLSILCFRLPSFGVELYQLWAQSYTAPVEELAGEFELNAGADLFAIEGLEAHLDWRRFHKAIYDKYGAKVLKIQEEDAEDKYEVTPGACKARLSRLPGEANTLNILVADQWLWHVLDTLAVLNQKIGWAHLPGYAQILKVFFLELQFQQRTGPLSPPLYKLSCTILSNTSLINPMTKFLLRRTNLHNVPAVVSAVELLGVWLYMLRSWRSRLKLYRLSHLETNDRWNFHKDDQYKITAKDEFCLLPPSFDYRFLSSALCILLTSEHTQVILTTLEFLYNSWDCFPERHADKLRHELSKVFFTLFLHWNSEVRLFYHTLLGFRVLKPHSWTLASAQYVDTPPHSRRNIDAVAADFTSALGPDEVVLHKRERSYSSGNLFDSVRKLSESLSANSSPRNSLTSTSPRSSLTSPRTSPRSNLNVSPKGRRERRNSDTPELRNDRKSRSVSDDFTRRGVVHQPMDPAMQLQFQRLLECIYRATSNYIEKSRVQEEVAEAAGAPMSLATWKKKGILLKQGYIYKNTWQQKHFSLQNNKLGYSESENGPIKREISVLGANIEELPNQIDQTHGSRIILSNCFLVDNGSQKFTLCAPSVEELREWLEVLLHNAGARDEETQSNHKQLDVNAISSEIDMLTGKVEPVGTVKDSLLAYTPVAVKEWLQVHSKVANVSASIARGEEFSLPVLLSRSSSYSDEI